MGQFWLTPYGNCRFWTASGFGPKWYCGVFVGFSPHFCGHFVVFCELFVVFCYIFFAQDGRRKGGVPEAEVVQNRQFIPTYGSSNLNLAQN